MIASTPEQWRAAGQTITVGKHALFYRDSGGDAPVLLLIHGFPTSSWDWAPLWEALSRDYRIIAPDMLGFGFSDKPKAYDFRIHEQADLLEDLLQQLEIGDVHVLAHDYGDTVAQEMLARQNAGSGIGRWQSLCLLNGGLFPETHHARLIQKLLLGPLGPLLSPLMGYKQFCNSFCAVFGADTQPSEAELMAFWQILSERDGHRILHRLLHYMTDRKQHRSRWLAALKDARIPVSLINGSADPVSGAHMVARYREIVRDSDFIAELPTLGHYPQCEGPDEVLAAWRQFMQERVGR